MMQQEMPVLPRQVNWVQRFLLGNRLTKALQTSRSPKQLLDAES